MGDKYSYCIKYQLSRSFPVEEKHIPCVFELTDLSKPVQYKLDRVVFLEGLNKGNYPVDTVLTTDEDKKITLAHTSFEGYLCIQLFGSSARDLSKDPIESSLQLYPQKEQKELIFKSRFESYALVYVTEEELDRSDDIIEVTFDFLILTRLYKDWIKLRIPKIRGMYKLPIIQFEEGILTCPKISVPLVFEKLSNGIGNFKEGYNRYQFQLFPMKAANNTDGNYTIDLPIQVNTNLLRITAIPYNDQDQIDLSIVRDIGINHTGYYDTPYQLGLLSQEQHEVYGEQGNYLSYIFHPTNLSTYDGIDLLQSPYRGSIYTGCIPLNITINFVKKGHVNVYLEGFAILRFCNGMYGLAAI